MSKAMFDEGVPMINVRSIGTIAVILCAAVAFSLLGSAGKGAQFGLIVVGALCMYLVVTMLACRVRSTKDAITVGVFPFRRKVPLSDVDAASVAMLRDDEAPTLRWRKNGIGLPGMQLGWFSTSKGKPVFAATVGARGRVLIPTRTSHDLLVSPRDPERLVEFLHSVALSGHVRNLR